MAVQNITYIDKVDLNETETADINKVQASDMNEIKSVVNSNATGLLGVQGTILWTNPNPTSAMANASASLSSDDYDVLTWVCKRTNSSNQLMFFTTIKGNSAIFTCVDSNGVTLRRGATYSSDTSYDFTGCNKGDGSSDNSSLIPWYAIGYNTGLFGGE